MPLILHLGNKPGHADRCFLATADMSITVKQAIQIVPKSNLGEGRGKHHTLYFCISRLIQNPQETLWMAAMTIQPPLPCDWPILYRIFLQASGQAHTIVKRETGNWGNKPSNQCIKQLSNSVSSSKNRCTVSTTSKDHVTDTTMKKQAGKTLRKTPIVMLSCIRNSLLQCFFW